MTPRELLKARWRTMRNRCNNPKATAYRWYGARGIKVCDRWDKSFEAFEADMGYPPSPRSSLDRIDSNGDYGPGNVRWATPVQQAESSVRPRRGKFDRTRSYHQDYKEALDFIMGVDE